MDKLRTLMDKLPTFFKKTQIGSFIIENTRLSPEENGLPSSYNFIQKFPE